MGITMSDVKKLFADYKNEKIALYGLGTETERVLLDLGGSYQIVGLLDSFQETGVLYGRSIISLHAAIEQGIKLIIVVARPGSCKAIEKRIGDICRENQIALWDIRGKDLLEKNQVTYDFSHIQGVTKEEVLEKINKADVISFDLFDTLIMRQTLSSEDVFQYVNCRLQEQGIWITDFCKKRLESEKRLTKNTAPTLREIYSDLLVKADCAFEAEGMTAEKLADIEYGVDFDLIVPRREVCDIFCQAVAEGKKVYVVSDTYYSKKQLETILEKCGITDFTDVMASSDYKTDKTQQLFGILKDREKGKHYLHIGDDIVADVESAAKWGINTCRLFSGSELLDMVGGLGLAEYTDTLLERLKVGMFISRIFNNPFQFETEDKRIRITDSYDIGYLLCAPMICDFVLWFHRMIKERGLQNIWLSARDGYLIKKLYAYLLDSYHQEDDSVYFLISRVAAIRAGVQTKEDIQYVDEMKFSGTLEDNLRKRFGIDAESVSCEMISKQERGLLKYDQVILEKAKTEREKYRRYIKSVPIRHGNIAFFDFVAKGTSQMFLQRLVDNPLKGLYFLQLEPEFVSDKGLEIDSFYSKEEIASSAIFENYYILETILTAPHPSVLGFSDEGEVQYAEETRKSADIACFQKAQEGILEYFMTYLRLCPKSHRQETKKLDEIFLGLIHGFGITDKDFLNLVVEDPFFNRMTNMTDVL